MRKLIVWGAGRIGRGFVAPLFMEGGWPVVFVDIDRRLVDRLNAQGQYTILRADKSGIHPQLIGGGFTALRTSQREALEALFGGDIMLDIAVHEPKLSEVADMLAPLIAHRAALRAPAMDIMMNVNMASPDRAFTRLMDERLTGEALDYFHSQVGVTGIAAMCISPMASAQALAKDPLTLINNGWPEQAIGRRELKAVPPSLPHVRLSEDVTAEETRKLYMLNMAHALCCYEGLPLGHSTVLSAMGDPALRAQVESALKEASMGLQMAYGFPADDMAALRERIMGLLDNPHINDDLPRLGADTRRKLARADRLVGPALLCLEAGGAPRAIARAIRRGFDFTHQDPGTEYVQSVLREKGLPAAVNAVCGLAPGETLFDMICNS